MMNRTFALALVFVPLSAVAQAAGGYSVDPSKPAPTYETVVRSHASPAPTQDRQFAGTRFWLLDPGRYEVEVWWDGKFQRDGSREGLLQIELEIGLAPHLQLDLYQNFNAGDSGFGVEGNQLELRYAFGSAYNELPLNPVLYLEWHPRKAAPDRAEVRLLLGGDLPAGGIWAANLFFEGNVDGFRALDSPGSDLELGLSAAANLPLLSEFLRAGLEVKLGADQHGTATLYPLARVGPNLVLKARPLGLKLTVTALAGLLGRDSKVEALAIAGWAF